MNKTDMSGNYFNDVLIALSLLTRLPLPQPSWPKEGEPARAAWAYPLAGLVVATLAGIIATFLIAMNLPTSFAAGTALMVMALLTGAMHEDGLADCADGFWGGWDRERRLKIMKDSNTGAYGVAAMVLSFGLRWSALSALFAAGWVILPLIAAAITSRAGMVWCMATLPNARADGLSSTTGRPELPAASMASLLALIACLSVFSLSGLILLIVVTLSVVVCALVAMRKVGGQTGDVLGATQQICEIALLGAMAALVV
jgi:adenosylcobinamide-GDP ribazoletransferase